MASRRQRSRARGWRLPASGRTVCRPGYWGNPFRPGGPYTIQDMRDDNAKVVEQGQVVDVPHAVELYRRYLALFPFRVDQVRRELAGRDLYCWCPEGAPCHGDVLLHVAAGGDPDDERCRSLTGVPSPDQVAELLRGHDYRYSNEIEFHAGIEKVLTDAGYTAQREVRLGPPDRIDFLMHWGLGIEVKIAGQPGDVWRQLERYAASPRVSSLLLVTTRVRHVRGLPASVGGKPLGALLIRGGL